MLISLKSDRFAGEDDFGRGLTMANFQMAGNMEEEIDLL